MDKVSLRTRYVDLFLQAQDAVEVQGVVNMPDSALRRYYCYRLTGKLKFEFEFRILTPLALRAHGPWAHGPMGP